MVGVGGHTFQVTSLPSGGGGGYSRGGLDGSRAEARQRRQIARQERCGDEAERGGARRRLGRRGSP